MKTVKQTILGIAMCVLSLAVNAQCVTITNLNVSLGANGTASITPVTTGTTAPMFTTYYWQMYPNTGQNNAPGQSMAEFQFPANGTYSVCLNISDSLNGCWSNQYCTAVTISNMSPSSCNASFTAYTDSNCVTYFTNTSTGNVTAYGWNINGVSYNTTNPSVSLPNGSYPVLLQTYYAGQLCDSAYQTITVGCSGTNTVSCQATFVFYTDSNCVTHFTNTSTGTNLTYYWYDMSNSFSAISSSANFSINLTDSLHYIGLFTYSNNAFCDSATAYVNINCNSGPAGSCHANSQFVIFADSTNTGNYFAHNLSSGSGNLSYLWNFGDGTSSTQQYPFHQYAVPAQYVVCLTVTGTYTNAFGGTTTCSDTYCDSSSVHKTATFLMSQMNVIPQNATGVKQAELSTGIKAYPNPMADQLILEASSLDNSKLNYVLTDALGRTVITSHMDSSKTFLNTSTLEKGFYSLSLTDEKGNTLKTIKLVK